MEKERIINLNSYRPEIDGLRAIAILSVILYHTKIQYRGIYFFDGGYLGVDIFFVISGYLISRSIISEWLLTKKFDFKKFYIKRARRILPMLFLVIIASLPLAWILLLPTNFIEYAKSILSSIYGWSNLFFYFNTTQYGAESSLFKPFLHTWSLGIEEQFYLIFPILSILILKFFRNYFLSIGTLLFILSLIFAEYMIPINPELNFYLPLSRFWELLIGSALAYKEIYFEETKGNSFIKLIPNLGIILVIYGLAAFDINTPHPSLKTLIPVLGVSMIIGYSHRNFLITKILSFKPLIWIGLISYSAYLWHYPLFAFDRLAIGKQTILWKIFLIFLTLFLSLISYVLVEKPFRNVNIISNKSFLFLIIVFYSSVTFLMNYAVAKNGFDSRLEPILPKEAKDFDASLIKSKIVESIDEIPINSKKKTLLIGDSHLYNWGRLNSYFSDEKEVVNMSYLGCRIKFDDENNLRLDGNLGDNKENRCQTLEKFFSEKKYMEQVENVILISFRPFTYPFNKYRFQLLSLLKEYSPNARVFVMGNYFQLKSDEFNSCLNLMFQKRSPSASICIENSNDYNPSIEKKELKSKLIDKKDLDYKYISLFELLRNNDGTYEHEYKSVPFMYDWNHLNTTFIDYIGLRLKNYNGKDENILELKNLIEF